MDELENKIQDDEKIKSEKKGINYGIVILLIVIFSTIFGIGGWFLGAKFVDNTENNDSTKVEDKNKNEENNDNKDEPLNNSQYTFYTSNNIPLKFGNKDVNMVVNYYVDEEHIKIDDNTVTVGKNNKSEVDAYVVRREFLLDGERIGNIHFVGKYYTGMYDENPKFDFSMNEEDFEAFGFKDAKTDEYFNVLSFSDDKTLHFPVIEPCIECVGGVLYGTYQFNHTYIFNEQGKILKELNLSDDCGRISGISVSKEEAEGKYYSSVDADYVIYPDGRWIDGKDNYFYYLKYDDNVAEYSEHKFSVEDGIVNDQILKTYRYDSENVWGAAGQTC